MRTILIVLSLVGSLPSAEPFTADQLPQLPERNGVAGPFAGVSQGVLLVAGGANFPGRKPWDGGTKVWHDLVYLLEAEGSAWVPVGTLPRPLGYGVSVTTDKGLLCIGGSDVERHYPDCFVLEWKRDAARSTPSEFGGVLVTHLIPEFPRPCANMCGARLTDKARGTDVVYVAGGAETPTSTVTLHGFWSLDLKEQPAVAAELEPWPGPPRMLAVAAVQDGSFFIASGVDLSPDENDKPVRTYLRDAYRFTPGKGWKQIADLPRPAVAAPSPGPIAGPAHFFVLGGDDGQLVNFEPKSEHPGFPRDVLAYHTITNTWTSIGQVSASRVTVPTTTWNGATVVPSGEVRPGVRSPEVWAFTLSGRKPFFGTLNYLVLLVYPALMVGVSFAVGQKQTTEEFFRGGQHIPAWAAGLSIFATALSSLTFMSIPAKAYATDWTFTLVNLTIFLAAPIVIHAFLPFFRALNVTTAYEYLERRFNLTARWFGSASFILMQFGRTAIVLYLPALALATVSEFPIEVCLLLMGVITLAMTLFGGFESVIWTDVAQAILLIVAALATLVVVVLTLPGGAASIWDVALTDRKLMQNLRWSADLTTDTVWVILIGNLVTTLVMYVGSQDIVQRYVSTRTQEEARRAIWINVGMSFLATIIFFSIGTALYAFYKHHPDHLDPRITTDAIYPLFMVRELPWGLGGLAVAGVFAAAQPTSSLNSIATAWVTDFHTRLFPHHNDAQKLRVARWVTMASGVAGTAAAIVMAQINIRSLWDAFLSLLGLTGGALGGLFTLGILSTRANGRGSMTGAITSVVTLVFISKFTPLHFFTYGAIGVATCCAVGWLASICLPEPPLDLTGLTLWTRTNLSHSTTSLKPGNSNHDH